MIVIIILGVIISNNNHSNTAENFDIPVDTIAVAVDTTAVWVDTTAAPTFFYCNDGKEIPYWKSMDGYCDCASCEDEDMATK